MDAIFSSQLSNAKEAICCMSVPMERSMYSAKSQVAGSARRGLLQMIGSSHSASEPLTATSGLSKQNSENTQDRTASHSFSWHQTKMRRNCHKPIAAGVGTDVDAVGEALTRVKTDEERSDLETIFETHYARIARVIAG